MSKIAYRCPTKEMMVKMIDEFELLGFGWSTSNWDTYREATCIDSTVKQFCSEGYYKEKGYEIRDWVKNIDDYELTF